MPNAWWLSEAEAPYPMPHAPFPKPAGSRQLAPKPFILERSLSP
ncbi:hypothetical protein [Calothrix sp. NIES-2100]